MLMFTKIRAFLWVCVLVMAGFAGTPPSDTLKPATLDTFKKWAIQFAVKPNFTLGSFQGSLLSGRYYFSPSRALQMGLSGTISGSDRNSKNAVSNQDLLNKKENNFQLSITTQYLWIFGVSQRVSGMLGIGPLVSYSTNSDKEIRFFNTDKHGYQIIKDNTVNLGLTAVVGVDVRLLDHILFTMFYRWGGFYAVGKNESENYILDIPTNEKLNYQKLVVNTKNVNFNGSVFFGVTLLFGEK